MLPKCFGAVLKSMKAVRPQYLLELITFELIYVGFMFEVLFGLNMSFSHDMSDWLGMNVNREWIDANVKWKDFGTGVRLGKLARQDKISLVLYDCECEVEVDAFVPHMHPGGEAYLVLEGEVYDDQGTYPKGSIVWMNPGSQHNPKTREKTLILVLWPNGVIVI